MYLYVIMGVLLFRLMAELAPAIGDWLYRTVNRLFVRRMDLQGDTLFDNTYIDGKSLYLSMFKLVPNISFINNVDSNKVTDSIQSGRFGRILAIYQRNWFNRDTQIMQCSRTIFHLAGNTLVEVGEHYVEILFGSGHRHQAEQMVNVFKSFEAKPKEKDFEISIINFSRGALELRTLPIQPVSLDIGLYYNDDFGEVDATIRERLARQNDKGIILLHGLPGTGKTTYLRHLIGTLEKKVMFVSPAVATNLTNPEFIDLLIENPNSVLVIEDAENIIMDRRYSQGPGVSNLLNISDGLLSDCLNVQVICTFNSALSTVDSALLRKGRLIARYEFTALNVQKANALSASLGHEHRFVQPATLAEIMNPGTTTDWVAPVRVIGFRPASMEN